MAILEDEEFSPIIEFLQEDRLPVNKELAKQIQNVAKSYSYENGLLYKLTKGNKRVIVIPKKLRNSVFHQMQEIPLAGNLGIRKTISRIETVGFWWKKIARDIKKWIRSCHVSCRVKPDFRKPMGTMELSLDFPTEPWQVLASDLIGPLPKSYANHEYLLVFVDLFSKWVELIPITKGRGKHIALKLVRDILCCYGSFKKLITDNGSQYQSKVLQAVLKFWGILQVFITKYHPQANPTERVNRNIKSMIASFVAEDHRTWDVHVAEFQFALNSVDHDAIGFSPAEIIFNRKIIDPLGNNIPSMETFDTTYLHKLELVRERIKRQQTRNKKFYDKRRREMNVQIGDKVVVKTFYLSNAKKNFSAKLAPRFKGPFEVIDFGHYKVNLKLKDCRTGKTRMCHCEQIKVL